MSTLHTALTARIITRGKNFYKNIIVEIIQSNIENILDVINNPVIFKLHTEMIEMK